jgi:ribonuclease III
MEPLAFFLQHVDELEKKISYQFRDRRLLFMAFTHRSYANEHRELSLDHNERLEFLGDSVLGLLIAEYLYRHQPDTAEGVLSHLRSQLVQAEACASCLAKLSVEEYLLLGRGERMGDSRGRESIRADLFEAIVGAIFLDGGVEPARVFLLHHFQSEINERISSPGRNYKADLQDYAQRKFQQTPLYVVESETGPDHRKSFAVSVSVDGTIIGRGMGASKKEAQQLAAREALSHLYPGDLP